MESTKFKGQWWLPGKDNPVGGLVTYTPENGVHIETFDRLDQGRLPMDPSMPHGRILGVTTENEAITLVNCRESGSSMKTSRHSRIYPEEYNCDFLLDGIHLPVDNIAFDKMNVEFPFLGEWAELRKIQPGFDIANPPYSSPGDRMLLEFRRPKPKRAVVNGTSIDIAMGSSMNQSNKGYTTGTIDLSTAFSIKPREPTVVFTRYFEHIMNLKRFLTLAMEKRIEPQSITGYVDESDKDRSTKVNIYYRIGFKPDYSGSLHPNKVLFQLSDIANKYERVLNNWYANSDLLKPVFDLYFATRYNNRMYTQNAFLSLTQALETYHRRIHGGRYIPKNDYGKIREDMGLLFSKNPENMSVVDKPSNIQSFADKYTVTNRFVNHMIKGTLKYANEYSLKARLDQLTMEFNGILEDLPYNVIGKERLITDTRNFLTHYDKDLKPRAADDQEKIVLIQGLRQLVEICLLYKIGIGRDMIKNNLQSKYSKIRLY